MMKRILALTLVSYGIFGVVAFKSALGIAAAGDDQVVRIALKKFEFSPSEVTVKKGTPVVLELTSKDVKHGFNLPDFHVRADVKPGVVSRINFTPDKAGSFTFSCDVFCGGGHEDMAGTLVVTE